VHFQPALHHFPVKRLPVFRQASSHWTPVSNTTQLDELVDLRAAQAQDANPANRWPCAEEQRQAEVRARHISERALPAELIHPAAEWSPEVNFSRRMRLGGILRRLSAFTPSSTIRGGPQTYPE